MDAFGQTLLTWHDFFLATSGASAALLGLLFVGVSINLGDVEARRRADLRARAAQAFANLVFVLIVSLIVLIPDPDPSLVAAGFGAVAAALLIRAIRNAGPLLRVRGRVPGAWSALRRLGWTTISVLILAFTAGRIWSTNGDANVIVNLVGVVFVLLIGAADISWEMLTEVAGRGT